jgi:hypothetical protein
MNLDERPLSWAAFPIFFFRAITGDVHMENDLFPSLDFNHLQSWAKEFVEGYYHGAGIDKITLRKFNLWNKEKPELAKAIRMGVDELTTEYMIVIHLSEEYESDENRRVIINIIHGSTIRDKKLYYGELGINDTNFLKFFKEQVPSDLCEVMQRFTFWCYGSQRGEDTPETNGYGWPLHADREGDFWQLYPIVKLQLPEQLGPARVTIGYETYVRLNKLFSNASSRGLAKEACEEIGARRLYIYEYYPNRTLIHDDELQDHGLPEADDKETFVRCDDLYCPIDTPSDDERYHYEESPEGFIFKVEKKFHLVPFSLIDFDRHYAKLSNVRKLGLLPGSSKAGTQVEATPLDAPDTGSADANEATGRIVKTAFSTAQRIDEKAVLIIFQGEKTIIRGSGSQLIFLLLKSPGKRFSVQDLISWENPGCQKEAPDGLEDAGLKKESHSVQPLQEARDVLLSQIAECTGIEEREGASEKLNQFDVKILKEFGASVKDDVISLAKKKGNDPMIRTKDSYRKAVARTINNIGNSDLKNFFKKNIRTRKEFYYESNPPIDWKNIE